MEEKNSLAAGKSMAFRVRLFFYVIFLIISIYIIHSFFVTSTENSGWSFIYWLVYGVPIVVIFLIAATYQVYKSRRNVNDEVAKQEKKIPTMNKMFIILVSGFALFMLISYLMVSFIF